MHVVSEVQTLSGGVLEEVKPPPLCWLARPRRRVPHSSETAVELKNSVHGPGPGGRRRVRGSWG